MASVISLEAFFPPRKRERGKVSLEGGEYPLPSSKEKKREVAPFQITYFLPNSDSD